MPLIPARKGVAFTVKAGQEVKITNTYGKQVLDFFAFHQNDAREYLSMVHTRTVNRKLVLNKGDKLYNARREPVLTLTEDTTPGTHDMIFAACDAERYRQMGYEGHHENCSDNLH
ncbi:hypothetical protein DL546_006259 [Coniochaeta pulveracea]|uniref:DUF1989 domain-containing protein n=1 Tax=Coniochaeta pulveracea TaxID=177199 RepID=A0A420Y712_9PEZI|nr:hypothetical protein DL546_006259 [Coniochaeta pulveracea]